MSRHVLVPIDGSEPAWDALDHAAAQHAGARITVLNVVDPVEDVYLGLEGGFYDADFRTAVGIGQPARTIVGYADENEVDHIVMGSHGRTGVARVLLGSVAEAVARRASIPVTIVR